MVDYSLMHKYQKCYPTKQIKKIANYKLDEFWSKTKNGFEIHNLAYQGVWFEDILDFANMRKDIVYNEWGCEHYGHVNWMKGAINYSDKVIAVWDGSKGGTGNCVRYAEKCGKEIIRILP